jgi:hypothetical protein
VDGVAWHQYVLLDGAFFRFGVVCHERSWSIQLRATVQEMKEGPSGSAIMG